MKTVKCLNFNIIFNPFLMVNFLRVNYFALSNTVLYSFLPSCDQDQAFHIQLDCPNSILY